MPDLPCAHSRETGHRWPACERPGSPVHKCYAVPALDRCSGYEPFVPEPVVPLVQDVSRHVLTALDVALWRREFRMLAPRPQDMPSLKRCLAVLEELVGGTGAVDDAERAEAMRLAELAAEARRELEAANG